MLNDKNREFKYEAQSIQRDTPAITFTNAVFSKCPKLSADILVMKLRHYRPDESSKIVKNIALNSLGGER